MKQAVFPTWMYHRTEPARIVQDPAEKEALGEDWADTPAAFLPDEPAEQEALPDPAGPEADEKPVRRSRPKR